MTQERDDAKTAQDVLTDKLGAGTTSGDKSKQTSDKAKGRVWPQKEIQALIDKTQVETGRKWKQVERERDQFKDEVGTLTTRLDDIETRQTARAYEEAKQDPSGNALRNIQTDEAARKRERDGLARANELARGEAQLKADREQFETESGETMVSVIAAKHGVPEERLAKLGITDKVALANVAADMKANTPETQPLTAEQEAAKAEAEDAGEHYTPADETPSGAKSVELTTEGVEKASMESLEQTLTPPIK